MYYLSDKLEITITNIGSIDKQSIEKDVKIEGYATKITKTKSIQIIELKDLTGTIDVVIFDITTRIQKGSFLSITGKVTEYNNKLQEYPIKIKIVKPGVFIQLPLLVDKIGLKTLLLAIIVIILILDVVWLSLISRRMKKNEKK